VKQLLRSTWVRVGLGLVFMAVVGLLLFWRGPSLHGLGSAFSAVA
jgi:hypothetical protein